MPSYILCVDCRLARGYPLVVSQVYLLFTHSSSFSMVSGHLTDKSTCGQLTLGQVICLH